MSANNQHKEFVKLVGRLEKVNNSLTSFKSQYRQVRDKLTNILYQVEYLRKDRDFLEREIDNLQKEESILSIEIKRFYHTLEQSDFSESQKKERKELMLNLSLLYDEEHLR